jgi:SNF2 family DNA or RNA helicase
MNENKLHFNIPENTILIFDEVQNCKNKETKNANVLEYTLSHLRKIRKSKQGPAKILILSATLTDKLEKIVYFGKVLGLFNTTEEYYAWISKEIQTNNKKFKDEIERELFIVHNTLFPEYGSRMESINLNLPTNKLFLVGCKWKDPVNKSLLETINLYKHLESKTHGLGAIIRKRQYLELVKVPVFCKMISDNISKKKKLVVLVNFKDTVSFIAQYLKQHNITYCVIEGGQGLKERQEYIDSFQNNEVDVILAIIQAGGVGLSLHDLQGKHPRVSLISITWSGQDTNQCFGRIARMGSKSVTEQYILFVLDSYEEYICKVMEDKLKILSGINNGNVNEFNLKKIRDS